VSLQVGPCICTGPASDSLSCRSQTEDIHTTLVHCVCCSNGVLCAGESSGHLQEWPNKRKRRASESARALVVVRRKLTEEQSHRQVLAEQVADLEQDAKLHERLLRVSQQQTTNLETQMFESKQCVSQLREGKAFSEQLRKEAEKGVKKLEGQLDEAATQLSGWIEGSKRDDGRRAQLTVHHQQQMLQQQTKLAAAEGERDDAKHATGVERRKTKCLTEKLSVVVEGGGAKEMAQLKRRLEHALDTVEKECQKKKAVVEELGRAHKKQRLTETKLKASEKQTKELELALCLVIGGDKINLRVSGGGMGKAVRKMAAAQRKLEQYAAGEALLQAKEVATRSELMESLQREQVLLQRLESDQGGDTQRLLQDQRRQSIEKQQQHQHQVASLRAELQAKEALLTKEGTARKKLQEKVRKLSKITTVEDLLSRLLGVKEARKLEESVGGCAFGARSASLGDRRATDASKVVHAVMEALNGLLFVQAKDPALATANTWTQAKDPALTAVKCQRMSTRR
jgi:hypothetical protein